MGVGKIIVIGILFLMFALVGLGHFMVPEMFVAIMPHNIPQKELLVLITGIAEVAGAVLLLVPPTRRLGATIILLLLLAYVPVHVNMCFDPDTLGDMPVWAAWLRLLFQFVLIYWAATLTAKTPKTTL